MAEFTLLVNGVKRKVNVDESTPLLWVLRDNLSLTGTKYGCGIAQCGACTVHIDGTATKSCITTVAYAEGKKITTIEGLSAAGLTSLQKAWLEEDVAQCGYCQVGMIMAAAALLKKKPNPTESDVDEAMKENICRCGTYLRIRKAIARAARGPHK